MEILWNGRVWFCCVLWFFDCHIVCRTVVATMFKQSNEICCRVSFVSVKCLRGMFRVLLMTSVGFVVGDEARNVLQMGGA